MARDALPSAGDLPLDGIKVADFSRLLPGPWCTQLLGDLGAEVIKIERPDGDPSRHNPPLYRREGVYFCSVNANKRSVALDLQRPHDLDVAHGLLSEADVVVESFATGGADKLGVGWEKARALNARVIYCAMTGFGQSGPLSHIAGHDLAIQAASGLLGVGAPAMPAFQAADYAAAATAAVAILAALRKRDRTGQGCYLDIAMYDCLFGMGNIALASALSRAAGGNGAPAMEVWGRNPRYALYPTRDGKQIAVCLLEAKIWKRFCEAIDRPDLIFTDEDSSARLSGHGERSELFRTAISAYCLARDRDDIATQMLTLSLPVMPVLTPDEAVASDHTRERELIEPVVHPAEGVTLALHSGLRRTGLVRAERSPAPVVGDAQGFTTRPTVVKH